MREETKVSTIITQTGSLEMCCFLPCLCDHTWTGAGWGSVGSGRSRGKVEGGAAMEKDVVDSTDTVPCSPSGL